MGVRSLGYLRLDVADMDRWTVFARDFLGLMPVDGADQNAAHFRMDHYPPRLVLTPAAAPAMTAMGLEVMNEREMTEIADEIERAGIKIVAGTDEERSERRVTGLLQFDDPAGNAVELFYGPVLDHVRVQTPSVSAFVTGDMGLGHVIVSAEDFTAAFEFYTRVLGFVERNTMGGGNVVFMGCNARHHTLGIAKRPGPGTLLHLMLEVATLDDVGLALDRAEQLQIPMMNSLGKHTNDHMVSFYVYSPELYAIEYGWNGLRVEEEEPTYEITKGAFWGHKFTPPATG